MSAAHDELIDLITRKVMEELARRGTAETEPRVASGPGTPVGANPPGASGAADAPAPVPPPAAHEPDPETRERLRLFVAAKGAEGATEGGCVGREERPISLPLEDVAAAPPVLHRGFLISG